MTEMVCPAESSPRTKKERKTRKKAAEIRSSLKQAEAMEACEQDTETASTPAAPAPALTIDALQFIGAEAYLLEDTEQIQKQRQANLKIRALLGLRKGRKDNSENSSNLGAPEESPRGYAASDATATDAAAAACFAVADVGSVSLSVGTERDSSPLDLPEFTPLPELPEAPSFPHHAPLRSWQHHQHHQLLRFQQRQVQQHERLQKARQQGLQQGHNTEISKEGPQPRHQGREAACAPAAPGAAAVAAAGAAAAAAGADFFGRLHAECLAALQMLRPSEEEERRKRETAGRVRAVCRLLWSDCCVEVFGSSFTALGLPGSDLDVCVFAEDAPPLHHHYACSRCLCCTSESASSSSSASGGSSVCSTSGSNSSSAQSTSDSRGVCGAEAADGACCCASLSKQHKRKGGTHNGLCTSRCCHVGSKGFQDLLFAAEQQQDADDACSRRETISKVREFARCLRDLNQAAATAKRRGLLLGGGRGRFADSIEPIVSARVPICKFTDAENGVAVDLSFDQPSAVLTSLYVRHKLKDFALLRPLIVINKMLLRHWELHEPFKGGIGSYLLFVMCLHFLQNNQHLSDTQKYRHYNLGHLLFQFLHYFGVQFNYEASAISVRGKGNITPKGQGRWRAMAKSREERMMLNAESPLDPSRDLGRSAYKIMQVRTAWRKAYVRLASRLMSEARRPVQGSGEAEVYQQPVLSCVFGCPAWPEELVLRSPPTTQSCGASDATTQRPGLWIPNEVAAAAEAAVDGLAGSSVQLRRLLSGTERQWSNTARVTSTSVLNDADTDTPSDSASSGGMRRMPWKRKQQQKQHRPSPLLASTRPNTHVIFDSSDSESSSGSDALVPVRGFAVSRSTNRAGPAAAVPATGTRPARTAPARVAAEATPAADTPKDVSVAPTFINVEDSSYSDSNVVELPEQHTRRESNKQKRKRRKQRQAAERRTRQKMQKTCIALSTSD